MAVNIIEKKPGSGIDIVIPEHQRSDLGIQPDRFGEQGEAEVIAPRFVYSKLGNLTDNKGITKDELDTFNTNHMESEDTSYQKFMMDMDRYSKFMNFPQNNIDKIDRYLGELGLTKEYPYQDDTYYLPQWLVTEAKETSRNVIYGIRYPWDTHAVTQYNVVYGLGQSETFNVIHDKK